MPEPRSTTLGGLQRASLAVAMSTAALGLPSCGDNESPVRGTNTDGGVDGSQTGDPATDETGGSNATRGDGASNETTGDPPESDIEILSVELLDNPNSTLSAIVRVETSRPANVSIRFTSSETTDQTGHSAEATEHELTVVGMRAQTAYALTAIVDDPTGGSVQSETYEYVTGSLPTGVVDYEFDVFDPQAVEPGITILGPSASRNQGQGRGENTGPALLGFDAAAQIVWYYAPNDINSGNARSVQQLADGNFLFQGNRLRVLTPGGNTVADFMVQNGQTRLHHDAVPVPGGGYLGLTNETRTVDVPSMGGDTVLLGDGLVEWNADGEIVWEWSSFDHLDTDRFPGRLSRQSGPGGGEALDWTHANGIFYVEADDTILMSLRHQNWVIKIDHSTGDVVWRLGEQGDFNLETGGWFYSQHNPTLVGPNQILVYDNGNERPGNDLYSRVVLLELDQDAAAASQLWDWRTDAYTSFLGGAAVLPGGHVLVCAGGQQQPNESARVTEVTQDERGTKIWELRFDEEVVYRANRISTFWPRG